jgi:outer membrane protein OmpA-like peptidoglycan-associated protein
MKKIQVFLFVLLSISFSTFAQDYTRPAALGVSFTMTDFQTAQRIRSSSLSTVLREKQWGKFKDMTPGLGITYFQGLTPHIDFAGTLMGSFINLPLENRPSFGADNLFLEVDASVNLKMLTDKHVVSPYLIAGVGAGKYLGYYSAFVPLGGGLKVNLFDEAAIFITSQYRIPVTKETNNYHFVYSFGIAGRIGAKKEEPVKVVEVPQAPKDTDGDGITDDKDQCPTVPGTVKYNGCPVPDTDKDGIDDEHDQCPTVPGTAKYNGCPIPDTDKDGINDEEDKCPTVAGVARYQGCPVPDTDNDGVNDEEDKCPTLPGTAANQGCPEVKQEIIKRVEYAAQRIYFATGSAKLLSKSFKSLDDVAKVLNEDQNLKLSIEGHTDNVGKDDYNQKLSEARANSVRDYFVKKGISESRLTSQGFGETQPIADNKTAAGRAKNRRVVMKLSYQ